MNQKPKQRMSARERRQNLNGYLFILPWLIGFLVFTLFPMGFSLFISMSKWNIVTGTTTIQFVGLGNFVQLFKDPLFYTSLGVTFKFCLMSIPLYQIMSLIIALLLGLNVRGMKIWRVVYFMPSIIPAVATAVLWQQILGQSTGLLNNFLRLFGIAGPAWLSSPKTALISLVIMGTWGIGNTMIIYLAGIQGVDRSVMEASEIDGANYFQRLIHVVLPTISPTIFFNVVMAIIGSFQYFAQAFVVTNGTQGGLGSPVNTTLFYNLYLYKKAFVDFQMGYASALAWIMFVIILIFTLLIIKSSSLWVFYQNDDTLMGKVKTHGRKHSK